MIDLTGRVAIVTGAGAGLGRAHARLLSQRGAKVVVNDLGEAADAVAREISGEGGQAMAIQGSVTDLAQMETLAEKALSNWGRIDILVNNAGILRDKTFAKMSMEDFRLVVDVHLMGAGNCTKAVWDTMRAQNYGRIVMTTSSSGLYGNFGQSNYSAAKMALVGLMQTLSLEGAKYNIRVNCLSPTGSTQMTQSVLPPEMLRLLKPDLVSPAVLALVSEDAPNRAIICAGAGSFEIANVTLTRGIHSPSGSRAAEEIIARWRDLTDPTGQVVPSEGSTQAHLELAKAGYVAANAEGH